MTRKPTARRRPEMNRSITTRKGDDGTTGLLYGQRVSKNHPQIEALGLLDELNVAIGFAKATRPGSASVAILEEIQSTLVGLMGEIGCAERDRARFVASKFNRVTAANLEKIDAAIVEIEGRAPASGWVMPGSSLHSVALDQARVIARRAERQLVSLSAAGHSVRPLILQYLNRISDLFFLLAKEA